MVKNNKTVNLHSTVIIAYLQFKVQTFFQNIEISAMKKDPLPGMETTGVGPFACYFSSAMAMTVSQAFSRDGRGRYSNRPWKLAPPVNRFGQGSPL